MLYIFPESIPICSTNLTIQGNDDLVELCNVWMKCSVNYSGNWAPAMKWQQDGGSVITAGVVSNAVPYKSVTSSLTVSVARNVTGSKFSCTTYFSEDNKPNNIIVSNVPDYSYTWTSSTVGVSCETL